MNMDREQAQPDPIAATSALLSDSFFRSAVPHWLLTLAALLLAAGLFSLSRTNYLFFHTLVELFFIVVSFTVFSIGWNSRRFVQHNALLLLSVAFVVIGSIELLHSVSYRGLGIFPEIEVNTSTQLWVIGRYLEAAAFVAAALVLDRKKLISPWLLLVGSTMIGTLAGLTVWPFDLFPVCYIDGVGLTQFKIISEYIICILLGFAILLFWQKRKALDRRVLKLLTASIIFSIIAELAFTLYVDIYGITSFFGHFAKFISVVLLYRVLVIGTLRSPYATLFRDLSKAKESLDLELAQRRKIEADLRVANRELDAFVRTVSHDLRSPLTPIIGLPELLLDQLKDQLDESSKKSLRDIRGQGLRMARILEDLLEFARAGRLIDGVAAAPIDQVLQTVLEDLGSRLIASGIVVEVQELANVALPRTALFQIFSNLIGNAIKYAGEAGSPIEISAAQEHNFVILTVRDHGPGIPPEERAQVFDVFYRGALLKEQPGSGIGLATVQKIAHYLNGDAWVEETPGGGATFRVRLQLQESASQQTLDFDQT